MFLLTEVRLYFRNILFILNYTFMLNFRTENVQFPAVDVDGKPLTQESGQKSTEIGYVIFQKLVLRVSSGFQTREN